MKSLDKSLLLLDEYFKNTPKNIVDKLFADVKSMFVDDISIEEYVYYVNCAFDISSHFDKKYKYIKNDSVKLSDTIVLESITLEMSSNMNKSYDDASSYLMAA